MNSNDTEIGNPRRDFPQTTWGMMSRILDPSDPAHRAGLEALCSRYWKPVYHYLRAGRPRSNEDAKDLTQSFFAWLLEEAPLKSFDPDRGSFRRFLKVLLWRFARREHRADHSLRRGGFIRTLSLDDAAVPVDQLLPDGHALTPDEAFDRVWMSDLVNRAVEAVRERCRASGREEAFRIFEAYDQAPEERRPTHAELARRMGGEARDVEAALYAVRELLRAEMRAEVARGTENDAELEQEWNALFGLRRPGPPGP